MLFSTTFNFCSLSQNVMEQFNPGLRNLVNLGKSYEKSVTGKHSFTLKVGLHLMIYKC